MTQLNLSGSQLNHTQQKPAAQPEDESIRNQTVGALGALAMFAAVIVIASCSRSSKPEAVQQPIQPATSAPASAVAVPTPAPVVAKAKAKTKTRRAANLLYVNREYGVSFTFPRNYKLSTQLNTGDQARLVSATAEPVQMDFVHPGGLALAAVALPGNSYPGTDFKSAFMKVSVLPGMTADECAQFASPDGSTGADGGAQGQTAEAKTAQMTAEIKTAQVKIGATEFDEVENPAGAMMKQDDAKYYHVFKNGACYEFALGIGTDGDANVEEITPVDRKEVFGRLEKILATVKFRPAVMPETQMTQTQITQTEITQTQPPTPAVAPTTPEHTSAPAAEDNQKKDTSAPNF